MGRIKEVDLEALQAASLRGEDFIANTRISNLADDTTAEKDKTCERVPQADLAVLLRQGYIRPKTAGEANGGT